VKCENKLPGMKTFERKKLLILSVGLEKYEDMRYKWMIFVWLDTKQIR
jgi:hypothetical protein